MSAPPVPPALAGVFGEHLTQVAAYADLLASDGVLRGLIGPREVERLWERHLLNCAVVADVFPPAARVVDVGSGAGLPGLVLACVRDDLRVDLVDPLGRRTAFLAEAVSALHLGDRVRVVTGRAEDPAVVAEVGDSEWVTARAVAPLGRLVGWCLPLLRDTGTMVALKGAQAESEIDRDRTVVARLGGVVDGMRDWSLQLPDVEDPIARAVLIRRTGPARPARVTTRSARSRRRRLTR